jgi:hypothetical protein
MKQPAPSQVGELMKTHSMTYKAMVKSLNKCGMSNQFGCTEYNTLKKNYFFTAFLWVTIRWYITGFRVYNDWLVNN